VPGHALLAFTAVRLGEVLPVLEKFWWGNPLLPHVRTAAQSAILVLKSILNKMVIHKSAVCMHESQTRRMQVMVWIHRQA